MRPYEVMVIFDVGAEQPAIQRVIDGALDVIKNAEGSPGAVDRWGRRPFAYEVKHRSEGYYVLIELGGERRTVAELDRFLGLADEVLRHRVVRLPDNLPARSGTQDGSSRPEASKGRSRTPQERSSRSRTSTAKAGAPRSSGGTGPRRSPGGRGTGERGAGGQSADERAAGERGAGGQAASAPGQERVTTNGQHQNGGAGQAPEASG